MADPTTTYPGTTHTAGAEPVWRPAGRRRAGSFRGSRTFGRTGVDRGRARVVTAAVTLALVVLGALLIPWVWGADQGSVDYDAVRQPPSPDHVFGTDQSGRDVLVRTALGIRVSLLVALFCAVLATSLGALVGAVCGAVGGRVDRIGMRIVDAVNALPHLLLGILIVAMYRGSLAAVALSIALTHWTTVARIVRAEVLSLRSRPFIDAAVSTGASRWRVVRVHLLPAVAPQCAVAVTLLLPHAVFHETTLSFLGLGLPAHLPSLGNMMNDARGDALLGVWWTLAAPAGVLVATTLALAGLTGWWRDRLVPRRRSELEA
ncbi:ABC transporter permease [Actinopolymorpha pittospori]